MFDELSAGAIAEDGKGGKAESPNVFSERELCVRSIRGAYSFQKDAYLGKDTVLLAIDANFRYEGANAERFRRSGVDKAD